MNTAVPNLCRACNQEVWSGARYVRDDNLKPVLIHDSCYKRWVALCSGRTHTCPVCTGSGMVDNKDRPLYKSERDYKAEGYLGQFAGPQYTKVLIGYERIACAACSGFGYWDHEPQPITETKTIGYR